MYNMGVFMIFYLRALVTEKYCADAFNDNQAKNAHKMHPPGHIPRKIPVKIRHYL